MGAGRIWAFDRQLHPALHRLCEEKSISWHRLGNGRAFFQLSDYNFWHQYKDEYKEPEEDEWEDVEEKQKAFEKTILCERYREEISDEDAYDEWYRRTGWAIQQDIRLFSGLEVLRLYGAKYIREKGKRMKKTEFIL